MTVAPLFLDTSIQISRNGSDIPEKQKIDKLLKNSDFLCTSTYVRLEARQALLQDWAYLYRVLNETKSAAETFNKVQKLNAHIGHKRKISIILTALSNFYAGTVNLEAGTSLDEKTACSMALYLENMIEGYWDWFEESVDHISDDTGCVRAQESPEKKAISFNVRFKACKQDNIKCRLNKFFEGKRDEFKKIHEFIEQLPAEDKKKVDELNNISKAIEKGLENVNNVCDSSVCRKLGDALIAVEAIHFKELFTKDWDQSEVICKALQLKSTLLI